MAMFVVLGKFTDQGAKNVREIHRTAEANMARAQSMGIKNHGWYLTQGEYDIVVIAEAPDAETMLAQAAGVAGTGNTRTVTMRAFTLAEADAVLSKLG
jgi:uncharacterized protein with GYD domain